MSTTERETYKGGGRYAWWQITTAIVTIAIAVWAMIVGERQLAWVFGIIGVLWVLPALGRLRGRRAR